MVIKVILLLVFFAVMLGIGFYSRKHATDVNGFVLGGRSVGPWLTAFAYGTSYFSAVVFVGYAGQFGYTCFHLDWNWQCSAWFSACMGCIGTTYKNYDKAFEIHDHAGFLWKTLWQ